MAATYGLTDLVGELPNHDPKILRLERAGLPFGPPPARSAISSATDRYCTGAALIHSGSGSRSTR